MTEISLTDFVDFVIKAGSPKLTKVRELINRGDYSPAIDYWKSLREHLPQTHRINLPLESILTTIDLKKRRRYEDAVVGYKKFLRKVGTTPYFDPPFERWVDSGLAVRVNPELGLCINGERHVVKLYFKDEEPTPYRLDAVLELMRVTLKKGYFADVRVAVLDVAKGKLITATKENPEFSLLLSGEAASFVTMWSAMSVKKNDESRKAASA